MKKNTLKRILKSLAAKALNKYKPFVIAVTGSVGKSSAKEAIFHVLEHKYKGKVRKTEKNYNNEIGAPCAILGISPQYGSFLGWFGAISKSYFHILFSKKFPEYLVLEMGADKPGDLKYLTSFIHPDLSVVTAIGDIPVHLEFFPEKKSLVKEKSYVLKELKKDGYALLNYDDLSVRDLKDMVKSKKILMYGFESGAQFRAISFENILTGENNENLSVVRFKIENEGNVIPYSIYNVLGKQIVYAVLAAAAAASACNINLIEVSQAMETFKNIPGRMNVLKGVKNTIIVDDSYNASPLSTFAALESIKAVSRRKIAVLGDMLELGDAAEIAHKRIGKSLAENNIDVFVGVGERMIFAKDESVKNGFDQSNIFVFHDSREAVEQIQEIIHPNDAVLVKGSQAMRMERITESILLEPEKAKDVLVRQEFYWKKQR